MFLKPYSFYVRRVLYLLLLISVAACVPAATQAPQAALEPATPTPEIFNPLDPSPTVSGSTLPLTCQVTDLSVYINQEWGYCFAYPRGFQFEQGEAGSGVFHIVGPALEDNANPLRASLEVTMQPVPEGSDLSRLVDAYLTSFADAPLPITRESLTLGGEPAETLEPVPGLLSSRVILTMHNNALFTLRFHPVDAELAQPDVDALTQTVIGSFAFFPVTVQPVAPVRTVMWQEFGRNISLSYDPILAPWVEARFVPAVPVSDQVMFAESQPAYAQFRFLGFQGGRVYNLPLFPTENGMAQVRVFRTADFAGFGDDSPQGFVNQMEALRNLLETNLDPARCAQPILGEPALPFLPWVNSKQTLCAQPQIIEFDGGRGVRYLTYYAQDPSPVLDHLVFYTFQGFTEDGQFYVSAFFPVQTGIFPTEPPACPQCGEPDYDPLVEWSALLTEQLDQLNAQPADDFAPSLNLLDNVIRSIRIGQ